MYSPPYFDSLDLLNSINPIKTVSENNFFNIQQKKNTQITSNEYAIIISGGYEQLQNYSRSLVSR